MRRSKSCLRFGHIQASGLALIVLAACSPTEPSASEDLWCAAQPSQIITPTLGVELTPAEFQAYVATRVPGGFGGWYFADQSNEVLSYVLKDLSSARIAEDTLRQILVEWSGVYTGSFAHASLNAVSGRYNYLELYGCLLTLRSLDGVVPTSLSISEPFNRIELGVASTENQAAVRQQLTAMGYPQDLVSVKVAPIIDPAGRSH